MNDYLTSLRLDISEDISIYRENIDFAERRIQAVNYIIDNLKTPKDSIQRDSMAKNINLSIWIEGLNIYSPTYDDMLNTGNLRLIKPLVLDENSR